MRPAAFLKVPLYQHLRCRLAPQSQGVVATAKHYVDNSQETNRGAQSEDVDERTQFEMYYPPFEGAISVGLGAVMCSYNKAGPLLDPSAQPALPPAAPPGSPCILPFCSACFPVPHGQSVIECLFAQVFFWAPLSFRAGPMLDVSSLGIRST